MEFLFWCYLVFCLLVFEQVWLLSVWGVWEVFFCEYSEDLVYVSQLEFFSFYADDSWMLSFHGLQSASLFIIFIDCPDPLLCLQGLILCFWLINFASKAFHRKVAMVSSTHINISHVMFNERQSTHTRLKQICVTGQFSLTHLFNMLYIQTRVK